VLIPESMRGLVCVLVLAFPPRPTSAKIEDTKPDYEMFLSHDFGRELKVLKFRPHMGFLR
jgi:hypothetical protein